MTWQPIETAPKDDSILLFEPWNPSHRIVIGWWRPADAYNDAKWTDGCVGVAATHWMPLPDPPQEPQPTASTGAPPCSCACHPNGIETSEDCDCACCDHKHVIIDRGDDEVDRLLCEQGYRVGEKSKPQPSPQGPAEVSRDGNVLPQGPALVREKLQEMWFNGWHVGFKNASAPEDEQAIDMSALMRDVDKAIDALDAQPEAVREARIQKGQPEAGQDVEALVAAVQDELFVNGGGDKGVRLQLRDERERDLGGFNKLAVGIAVRRALARLQPQEREK